VGAETIPALLALQVAAHPDQQAIVGDTDTLTYAELAQRSLQRAAWFIGNGVNKGHRVGLQMPNGVEWAINAYALLRIGAVLVPLSTLLRPSELHAQLCVAGVRHLIATPTFRGRNYRDEFSACDSNALPSLRGVWWAGELGDVASAHGMSMANALAARVVPADDMAIIFTSGSSGTPKGVIHTHGGAIRANAAGLAARCIRADTRLYLPMPFFWAGGFAGGLLSALNAGATLLTEAVPEPGATLAFLAREKATLFRGWPDQAAQLAAHPRFGSTDLSALGAGSLEALLPAPLQGPAGSRANLFGMTESFGPYCGYPLDEAMPQDKWGSCGRPFDGVGVRIAAADSGELLPAGEMGSIQIGGRNILRGICGREREDVFTADGWYDTGDLGYLDADEFLYFRGRADDMIRVKGATVYPVEVESALQNVHGVERAIVMSIDLSGNAAIGAVVVTAPSCKMTLQQLRGEASARLSAYKLPSRWLLLDAQEKVPRTASGKIDKAGLRSLLLAGPAGPD
jgi:acyl-CoA synthetase (AMP-forming)/AMP-acid ligase II